MKKSLLFTVVAIILAIATVFVGVLLILDNIGEPTVIIGSVKGLANDVVEVPVTIKNNPGIWGGQIIIDYDSNYFDFESSTNGDVFDQCQINDTGENIAIVATNTVTDKKLKDSKKNGKITTLKFRIKATAKKGQKEIKFNTDTNFCNKDLDLIEFAFKDGVINVK